MDFDLAELLNSQKLIRTIKHTHEKLRKEIRAILLK